MEEYLVVQIQQVLIILLTHIPLVKIMDYLHTFLVLELRDQVLPRFIEVISLEYHIGIMVVREVVMEEEDLAHKAVMLALAAAEVVDTQVVR